jgi:magnesium chelatase subunit D
VEPDPRLLERIAAARSLLPRVQVPDESLDHLVTLVEQNGCRGHRGDLSLWYAGRAYAALQGEAVVTPNHLNRVGELVFAHRRPVVRDEEPAAVGERETDDRQGEQQPERQDAAPQPHGSEQQQSERSQETSAQDGREAITIPREAAAREEVMGVGEPFKVRRLLFRKDRRKRRGDGRRTRTHIAGRDGWPVKTALHSQERDIALGATIRACAPFQAARGRVDRLLIGHDDLRFHRREGRMGHLVVFVVDGSGSMGAQRRMVAAKGAIQALLLDCYQKRDRVAMIVFRKDRAELVLPPTTSVELAAKQLATLPVGGKTPLAAGLLETYRLVQRVVRRHPETRILVALVTDGRGNHALGGDLQAEIRGLARLLAEQPQCDFLVIDTENKRNAIRTDLARTLARQLAAEYYTIETLQAEQLAALVQSHTAAG